MLSSDSNNFEALWVASCYSLRRYSDRELVNFLRRTLQWSLQRNEEILQSEVKNSVTRIEMLFLVKFLYSNWKFIFLHEIWADYGFYDYDQIFPKKIDICKIFVADKWANRCFRKMSTTNICELYFVATNIFQKPGKMVKLNCSCQPQLFTNNSYLHFRSFAHYPGWHNMWFNSHNYHLDHLALL